MAHNWKNNIKSLNQNFLDYKARNVKVYARDGSVWKIEYPNGIRTHPKRNLRTRNRPEPDKNEQIVTRTQKF